MINLPILETERLRIRPYTMDDFDQIYNLNVQIGWVNEKETVVAQREHQRQSLQWQVQNYWGLASIRQPPTGDRLVEFKESGEFVGACGINHAWLPMRQLPSFGGQEKSKAQAEVSLMWKVLPALWGNGYATEVAKALIAVLFKQGNLRRVVATTEHENLASQRVMVKAGMRAEKNPYPAPSWFQVVGIIEAEDL
jgi:[ribosomal protein S5]-alanine N-acetyltransferase